MAEMSVVSDPDPDCHYWPSLSLGKFGCLLVDPPWHYNNRKTGGERKDKTKFGGGARKHYPLMADADLLAMDVPISFLSLENSALFLWATYPRLDFAIELLKQWGFRYATIAFTWIKSSTKSGNFIYGPGYYTASNPEVVLLGIKGSMEPSRRMVPSIIKHPRLEHSRKPSIHPQINEMYPDERKIELFARRQEDPDWEYWGNEIEKENPNAD